MSHGLVATMVRNGRLQRVGRGVYIATSAVDTFEHRMAVACALTKGVVCFPTAGKVWTMRGVPRRHEIHVLVAWERRIDAPDGVVVHRSRHLPEGDIVRRGDAIAVTAPPRTVFDAARLGSPAATSSG